MHYVIVLAAHQVIQRAWELGLSSTCIPPEYGGVGLSSVDNCLITEELAWGCSGFTTSIMANDLGLMPIVTGDTAGSAREVAEWKDLTRASLAWPARVPRLTIRQASRRPLCAQTETSRSFNTPTEPATRCGCRRERLDEAGDTLRPPRVPSVRTEKLLTPDRQIA